MAFLLKPAWSGRWSRIEIIFSLLCTALTVGAGGYLFQAYETYHLRAGMPTTMDVIWGMILILMVLEAPGRIVGNALTLLAIFFLVYMYLGRSLPLRVVSHRGFSLSEIAEVMYLGTDGIHGLPLTNLGQVRRDVYHFRSPAPELRRRGIHH